MCSQYDHKATRPAELELFKHFKALKEIHNMSRKSRTEEYTPNIISWPSEALLLPKIKLKQISKFNTRNRYFIVQITDPFSDLPIFSDVF